MPGFIALNTISSVRKRLAVNRAVLEAIGGRLGGWRVYIDESIDKRIWNATVKGPNGFFWTGRFGGRECTPACVGSTVRAALEKVDEELYDALAELAKEDVMYTRDVRPDGKVEYVIGGARLTGEEVKFLRNRGALTRRGIQHYLVGRR